MADARGTDLSNSLTHASLPTFSGSSTFPSYSFCFVQDYALHAKHVNPVPIVMIDPPSDYEYEYGG